MDSWIYDRVEAIGGASGFLYGAGGVGGTLNYITKLAQRDSFTEGQLRLGSYGLKEASVGLNRRLGDATDSQGTTHYLRLDLNHRDAGSWVGGTQSRSTQLAASLLSDLGGGLTHTLAYEAQHERVDRPYWGTPLLNPLRGQARIDEATLGKNYNSADGLYAQRVQWLRSITEWRASDRLKLSNTFYAYDALRDYRNVETYRFTPDNSAVVRSAALLQRHDQRMVGDRIEGSYLGELAGRRSEWAFGLDVSVNRQTRFPNSLSGTVSTVNPYDFTTENFYDIPGMAPGFRPDRDNKVTTTALYLENRTALTPALHLLTALRHERIEVDLTNRRDVTPALPASYSRSYSPTTGRVGLVWDATPEANLYAQFSTAADPPSGMLMGASFADAINNTGLTTGRQVEAGSKLSFWQGKGTAALAIYHITRRNISTQDPQDSTRTVLVGQQSSRGVELSMGLAPTPRWSVQGNWSHVDARYDNYQQGGRVPGGQAAHEHARQRAQPLDQLPHHAGPGGQRRAAPRGRYLCRCGQHPVLACLHAAGPGPELPHRPAHDRSCTAAQCHGPRLRRQPDQHHGLPGGAAHGRYHAARGVLSEGRAMRLHLKRWLFLLHRWLGIAVCLFFSLWFVSGMVMMYVGYPKLTEAERLRHLPPLDGNAALLAPTEALRAAGIDGPLKDLRLHAGSASRASYLATPEGRRQPVAIDAASGQVLPATSEAQALASARAFAGDGTGLHYLGTVDEDAFSHSRALDIHAPCTACRWTMPRARCSTSPATRPRWCAMPRAPSAAGTTWAPGCTGCTCSGAMPLMAPGPTSSTCCRWSALPWPSPAPWSG